jgi:hypothetical protein
MAWSGSSPFFQMIADTFAGTQVQDLNAPSDTLKSALYNNSITPSAVVSAANSAYNAGQWANSNELTSGADWPAGGKALANPTFAHNGSGTCKFDGDDTASGSSATITGAYGALTYNDTDTTPVADPGICYNYFGGAASVTGGVLTVVWHANGLFTIA